MVVVAVVTMCQWRKKKEKGKGNENLNKKAKKNNKRLAFGITAGQKALFHFSTNRLEVMWTFLKDRRVSSLSTKSQGFIGFYPYIYHLHLHSDTFSF